MQERTQRAFEAVFYETTNGKQPVREFIKDLTKEDQKEVGADIRIVQENFPIGLPLVRKVKPELWEIRSTLKDGICRVFFTFFTENIVLLHAFVKKTQKTPPKEIDIAFERLKDFKRMQK
jgi:phage-related protein